MRMFLLSQWLHDLTNMSKLTEIAQLKDVQVFVLQIGLGKFGVSNFLPTPN